MGCPSLESSLSGPALGRAALWPPFQLLAAAVFAASVRKLLLQAFLMTDPPKGLE